MASTNFVVTSLPAYVATNRDMLIKNFALAGGNTRKRMTIQTGVKYKEYLNYLELAPTLQDGSDCGFTSAGSATLTQRTITAPSIKIDLDICPRKLIGKYAEYLVRNNAKAEDLPFEEYIMQAVVNDINRKIEKLIWQGDTSKTSDAAIKWTDGLLKIAGADSAVVDVDMAAANDAYTDIKTVVDKLTEETLERGGEVYVSPALYRSFMSALVEKNYYHYSGSEAANDTEFYFPGTGVKVVCTPGLAGSTSIVGTFAGNLVYGCDIEGDSEDIDLWYSKDDRVFKLEALWNTGVQFAYPDQVVLGTKKSS